MEPTESGLIKYEPIISAFDANLLYIKGISFEYPFPQVFIGKNIGLLCTKDNIFLIDLNSWNSLYLMEFYDFDNTLVKKSITPGGIWHFIDMGDTWFLVNGVDTVFMSGKDVMLGNTQKAYIKTGMPFNTGSYYKGRVVFGGLDYSKFWSSNWQTMWDSWVTKVIDTGININRTIEGSSYQMPVGKNWIWWSMIGAGDVQMLFDRSYAYSGYTEDGYDKDNPIIFDLMKRNEQGFTQLPTPGDVYCLKELGDYLIAYTTTGIFALRHTAIEIGSTLALITIPELEHVGLLSQGAVNGNKEHHVFIDRSGFLWEIRSDLSVIQHGYREYLNPMIGLDPMIYFSANPTRLDGYGEFYIASLGTNYKLVKQGLLSTTQEFSSAHYIEGATIGICTDFSDAQETEFATDVIDFGNTGIKRIMSINIFGEGLTLGPKRVNFYAAIDYRFTQSQEFTTSSWKKFNPMGAVFFPISGIEFRIRIKSDDYRRTKISRITVNYQEGDRRFKRGLDVSKT